MALQIIRNNIINVQADAVVNTANPNVAVGRGVDHAIFEAAGREKLLEARAEIGEMIPGQAAYTPAFGLEAKYIIHAVGPAWRGGSFGERETVAACYRNSLWLARQLDCESIAFPLLATGTYGFPKDEALRIAMAEISAFLLENEMEVLLVVYDKESFEVSGKLFSDIKAYIGDSDVRVFGSAANMPEERMLSGSAPAEGKGRGLFNRLKRSRRRDTGTFEFHEEDQVDFDQSETAPSEETIYEAEMSMSAPMSFPTPEESLDERLKHMDKTFQQYLFMLIDRRGLTDPEVYKKANIDRKHFSKIRSNIDYKPGKRTALALAIALELSLDETRDLLSRAGLALSPSILADVIVEYCIGTRNYDINEINCILFNYEQPILGA